MTARPLTPAHWLRTARQARGWTQAHAAARLGVSQTYLSLLESGRRSLSSAVARRLSKHFEVPATHLPLLRAQPQPGDAELARSLGRAGYPGFTHLKRGTRLNPAQVLVSALRLPELDPRTAEALPWLVRAHADLDWAWVVRQAKLRDLQNRVGFVVALGRELATRAGETETVARLTQVEHQLERSRLAREDTLCHESITEAERRWHRTHRSPLAAHWNLLTGLVPEHLSHGH